MADSVKSLNRLTLSEAQKTGRLQVFALEQEGLGVGPIAHVTFDNAAKNILTKQQSPNQTLDSHVPDYLSGKKTR